MFYYLFFAKKLILKTTSKISLIKNKSIKVYNDKNTNEVVKI